MVAAAAVVAAVAASLLDLVGAMHTAAATAAVAVVPVVAAPAAAQGVSAGRQRQAACTVGRIMIMVMMIVHSASPAPGRTL